MKIDHLIPDVQVHLPECPKALIRSVLKKAVVAELKATDLWVYSLPVITVTKGKSIYPLDIPCGTGIKRLSCSRLGDNNIALAESCGGTGVRDIGDGEVELIPVPVKSSLLRLKVVLSLLSLDSLEFVPDNFIDDDSILVEFALWKLMLIPHREWSDSQMAIYHKSEYLRGSQEVRTLLDVKKSIANPMVKMRAF